ncbi:MAG: Gfo/Idh/MocA family oxidoreductase [Candidatus Electryonea clarkiae]|nr:Gfo/Idh/MocA family oxidoreductase [Candidatus Electryonea clarkiae]MDP8286275.1 Gfo/Idh/MocA family oxidoreductase [Candidatus Electryonea clarkiae]
MVQNIDYLPKDRPVRVGVVGLSGLAQVIHLPLLVAMEEVELVGICDQEAFKLGKLSDKYDVPGFLDIHNFLKKVPIDVAFICTPTISHLPLALTVLQAGAHVVVEKPVARNLEESIRLVEAAEQYRRCALVAMNLRFRQDVAVLKNFLRAGELGRVWRIRAGWLKCQSAWARSHWLDQPDISGGGVLMDLGLQILDVVNWLMDWPEVKRVVGFTYKNSLNRDVEDTVSTMIEYENKLTLQLECSWGLMTEHNIAYTYFDGMTGSATLNPLVVHKSLQGELVNVSPVKSFGIGELYQASFKAQLSNIIYTLRGETTTGSTAEEAVKTMRLVDLIYRSARESREIFPGDE